RMLMRRAGHILGAATLQIDIAGKRIVFSGDLGRYCDPVMHDPEPVTEADYIVVESTYGNRRHDAADPQEALAQVIERTVSRSGTVVVPACALGRVQSLIYQLWRLKQAGRLKNVPICLDSHMATSATELLCRHNVDHKLTAD